MMIGPALINGSVRPMSKRMTARTRRLRALLELINPKRSWSVTAPLRAISVVDTPAKTANMIAERPETRSWTGEGSPTYAEICARSIPIIATARAASKSPMRARGVRVMGDSTVATEVVIATISVDLDRNRYSADDKVQGRSETTQD